MTWDDFETSEDIDRGGEFLDQEGTYHFAIVSAERDPSFGGKMTEGIKLGVVALEGTPRTPGGAFSEKDKTTNLMFFAPKLTQANQGEFNRKRITRLLVATNQIDRPGQKAKIDPQRMIGQQVIARLRKDDAGKYLELSFLDIWHVDDPEASKFPRSKDALAMLRPDQRRSPESFAGGEPKTKSSVGQEDQAAPAQTVPASAVAVSRSELDEL